MHRRFPPAALYGERSSLVLELESGNELDLRVCWNGESTEWPTDPDHPEWKRIDISLTDIGDLAEFIHALVCRYNALVDQANSDAAQSAMKQLQPISSG
jgi:hypothetical protein